MRHTRAFDYSSPTPPNETTSCSQDSVLDLFLSLSLSLNWEARSPGILTSRLFTLQGNNGSGVLRNFNFLHIFLFRYYVIHRARFWRITWPSAQNKSQNRCGSLSEILKGFQWVRKWNNPPKWFRRIYNLKKRDFKQKIKKVWSINFAYIT